MMTDSGPQHGGRSMCIVREREVYELGLRRESEAFRDAGLDVHVICMADGVAPAREIIDGVTVHRLAVTKRREGARDYLIEYSQFLVAASVKLVRLHRHHRFELVQVNTMPDFLVLCTLIPKLTGARISVYMKEPTPELGFTLSGSRKVEKLFRQFERLALRYADVAFTVTDELRQTYIDRGADPDKVHVVLNSPAVEHLTGGAEDPLDRPHVKRDRFTVICHGTIEERYGHDVLLRAIDRLRADIPDIELRITGKGGYLDGMLELVTELGLEDQVSYLGWIGLDELVDEIRSAHVGVVAQISSPYSNLVHTNKMFDYIMLGVPCVASRLKATTAAFPEGALAYYESTDPDDLAAALKRIHDDPAHATSLVHTARRVYEESDFRWSDQREVLLAESLALIGLDARAVTSSPSS